MTTCISYSRPGIDDPSLTERLDVTAGNPYYAMQDGLEMPAADGGDAIDWNTKGAWALYHSADRMYSSKQAPYLVTETNAQAIGMPWWNEPAYDGQWRQAAWALVSRGAAMIEYWQWQTLHFGAETYWGGVLPHSQQPGRTYRELAQIGKELRKTGGALEGLVPGADVAVLYSKRSEWALAAEPQIQKDDGSPEHRSFEVDPRPVLPGRVRRRAPGPDRPHRTARSTRRRRWRSIRCWSRPGCTRRTTTCSTGLPPTPRRAGTW